MSSGVFRFAGRDGVTPSLQLLHYFSGLGV